MKLDRRTIISLSAVLAYIIVTYMLQDSLATLIATSNILVSVVIYMLLQPVYLFFIYGVYKKFTHRKAWKRVMASLLVIISLDMLAFPRLGINEALVNGSATNGNIGSVIMRAIEIYFPHTYAHVAMYIILPLLGLTIALELLGISNFWKEVKR